MTLDDHDYEGSDRTRRNREVAIALLDDGTQVRGRYTGATAAGVTVGGFLLRHETITGFAWSQPEVQDGPSWKAAHDGK